MKSYRDEAIVLRTHKLGEADRIITLLTAEHGQVRAVAKGVRKTTSKFGARVEPFSVIDAQLHRGRTLDTLTQVASIAQYGDSIAANYDLYLAATVVVETAERLTADAHDGTHSQYLLLLGALNALARGCGTQGPHSSFSIPDGGTVCDTCRPPGASSPAPDTVALLGQLLSGDWERADRCEPYARTEASGLISSYTQWHLERRLRSLSVIDRSHS